MITLGNFKMERPGLVKEGDVCEIREGSLPNSVYYYVVEPAVAMSANIPLSERLLDHEGNVITKGTVKEIEETDRGYYLTMEFEE
jgi:hypothetical protein